MPTTAVTTSAKSSSATDPDALVPSVGGSKTLSQNDFLNLLIAQMKAQDPLHPQSNTEMAAQMAQFTSLQQANTMSGNIATLLTQSQISQANNLLGSTVTLQVDKSTITSGVVQSVQINAGQPQIVVNNSVYDLSQVLAIKPTVTTPAPTGLTAEATTPPADRSNAAP